MKPLFGIDITTNKKNEEINGKQFVVRAIDETQMQAFERRGEALGETINRTKLPCALRVIKTICGYLTIIVLVVLVRAAFDIGLAKAYENAPYVFYATPALALVWLALTLLSRKREKNVLEEENAEAQAASLDRDVKAHYEQLGVPADAVQVDVLMFHYKLKDGNAIPQAPGFAPTPFVALDLMAFATEDALCIADLQELHSIPKIALRRIYKVNKRISVLNWNKEEPHNKGQYKQYKMTMNNMGMVFFKPYYVLELEIDGELWGIYFPCYERESFERLTGLHTEQ